MRVVSLVPSWTETLLTAGINVVGRTRYCVHPAEAVTQIPIVGGTKNWDWDKVIALKPDLLVLDQEENPRFMAEQTEIPFVATHVTSIADMPGELALLNQHFHSSTLGEIATQWANVVPCQGEIPGIIRWGSRPTEAIDRVLYVIWKNPWMVVSQDTFIGNMLQHCGVQVDPFSEKYPKVELEKFSNKPSTLLLFSSEPYPFLQHEEELNALGFPFAFVDGEKFSWFGIRSLRFLQSLKG